MPRLQRVTPVGVPTHIIQRGNNYQVCFGSEDDMMAYAGWLKEYSKKYTCVNKRPECVGKWTEATGLIQFHYSLNPLFPIIIKGMLKGPEAVNRVI